MHRIVDIIRTRSRRYRSGNADDGTPNAYTLYVYYIDADAAVLVTTQVKARNEPSGSGPFRWGHTGPELTLSDLVLVDVKQVSKGSFQPTLAARK